jgi:anti-anti-sigma factor
MRVRTESQENAAIDQTVIDLQNSYLKLGVAEISFPDLKMEIRRENIPGDRSADLIKLAGKVTNENSYDLNQKINRFFSDLNNPVILFDLSDLTYANSMGVAILIALYYRVKENGGEMLIGGIHPFLDRVFRLMDMPHDFIMHETMEEAKLSLKSTG